MAEYVYPALFQTNEDGSYTITFPDLPGCISEGKSLGNAIFMAQDALTQWIEYLNDKKQSIPDPTSIENIPTSHGQFLSLICADVKKEYAVRRTISIPKWMDEKAVEFNLSLSRVLQDALKDKFNTF